MGDTNEVRLGWKVVKRFNMSSCYVSGDDSRVRYRCGEWVQPRKGCGPLCVFDSRDSARSFSSPHEAVLECFYTPSKQTTVWTNDYGFYWLPYELPRGTVLADAVYIIP